MKGKFLALTMVGLFVISIGMPAQAAGVDTFQSLISLLQSLINSLQQLIKQIGQSVTTGSTVISPNSISSSSTSTSWSCGKPVTFTYKGQVVTYGTVESQGRCWLDRNLGASRVATDSIDKLAAGDLFQWGRGDDGHQDCNLAAGEYTTILSASDNPGHDKCIMGNDDWRTPKNDNLWQGVNGINNPCPQGWRVPTKYEWEIEQLSWSSNNAEGAFNSPLKLPTTGVRVWGDQPLRNDSIGAYWSSTVPTGKKQEFDYSQLPYAYYLTFRNYSVFNQKDYPGMDIPEDARQNNAAVGLGWRANGYAVRCIKD